MCCSGCSDPVLCCTCRAALLCCWSSPSLLFPSLESPFTGFTATPTAHTVHGSDEEDPEMTLPTTWRAGIAVGHRQKLKNLRQKSRKKG